MSNFFDIGISLQLRTVCFYEKYSGLKNKNINSYMEFLAYTLNVFPLLINECVHLVSV